MKIQITKKNIIITPAPKRNKKNGLVVYFCRNYFDPKLTSPIAKTDLIKGQRKYSIPYGFICNIKQIEF